jgi:DNA polymerase V
MTTDSFFTTTYKTSPEFSQTLTNGSEQEEHVAGGQEPLKWEPELYARLTQSQAATCLKRVHGDAMSGAGILNGDVVIVDRSIKTVNGRIVIAVLDGTMLIRRFALHNGKIRLIPETTGLSSIDVDPMGADFSVWGVVTHVIHPV